LEEHTHFKENQINEDYHGSPFGALAYAEQEMANYFPIVTADEGCKFNITVGSEHEAFFEIALDLETPSMSRVEWKPPW
jgi:hypothetical protein